MAVELPTVTHRGVLKLGNVELRVYQLSDGQRVIDADDVQTWVAAMKDGSWTLTDDDALKAAQMLRGRVIEADWVPVT